ncbi:hypothetical protein SAMN02745130_00990 [Thiothrix eikelboomii]|uniref:Uncharacterized protein n=1 Tax=Thiothrix eikelboomii TaxID=92487 RepID=A0A1T4W4J8_9GAMM|nr:hypothetical protein [Thiothrix eikelboomii]SKA72153.1 hypothetical protein SAMN02745130_00990 [Thiothrix eikelboomii]
MSDAIGSAHKMDNKMQIISDVSTKLGSTMSIGSAAVAQAQQIWGYSVDEWTVLIGVGGLVVALAGFLVSSFLRYMDYHDKVTHRKKILEINMESLRIKK